MKYLPDTNIFIMAARGYTTEAKFLSGAIKKRQIAISAVVAAEFLTKADASEEKGFQGLLSQFSVIPIDIEVAKVAARYRRDSLKSKKAHMLDCFLAAQAKLNNLTLVSNNKADFPIEGVKIIALSK